MLRSSDGALLQAVLSSRRSVGCEQDGWWLLGPPHVRDPYDARLQARRQRLYRGGRVAVAAPRHPMRFLSEQGWYHRLVCLRQLQSVDAHLVRLQAERQTWGVGPQRFDTGRNFLSQAHQQARPPFQGPQEASAKVDAPAVPPPGRSTRRWPSERRPRRKSPEEGELPQIRRQRRPGGDDGDVVSVADPLTIRHVGARRAALSSSPEEESLTSSPSAALLFGRGGRGLDRPPSFVLCHALFPAP
mmetsp:Transcript_456/g.1196  ORF Transcript_456/g.1196 Transcript_456/m.1196 type:complete len:244 (+) Transcript_456:1200-1931(+)